MSKITNLIEEVKSKISKLESQKANLEWHNAYGPPLAMVCLPLKELQWILEELKEIKGI